MNKGHRMVLFGVFLLFAAVSMSIPRAGDAQDPTFLYLGTIFRDYPERLAIDQLNAAGAEVLLAGHGMILFRLTPNIKTTRILEELPFLKAVYTDPETVLGIPKLKRTAIAGEFVRRSWDLLASRSAAETGSGTPKTMLEIDARIRGRAAMTVRADAGAPYDDLYEPNDTFETAVGVVPGVYEGLQSLDDDWYRIDLVARKDLVIQISETSWEGDLHLELYQGDGVLLDGSDYGGWGSGRRIQLAKLPSGSYFLKVPHTEGTAVAYTLTVRWGSLLGTISGRITSEATGAGLEGVYIKAFQLGYESEEYEENSTYSGDSGDYSVAVAPESYCLFFDGKTAGGHLWEYYSDREDPEDCDWVTVIGSTDTPGADAALTLGGRVSGRVTSALTGTGIGGVDVFAFRAEGEPDGYRYCYETTDSEGNYVLPAVRGGAIKVQASGPSTLDAWYDQKPDRETADLLTVTAGAALSNIDFAVPPGGTISGRVTDALTGAGIGRVFVRVRNAGTTVTAWAVTDANGDYSVARLPTGSYFAEFAPLSLHLSEWYDDKAEPSATPINVTEGHTASGIDARLEEGGIITGRVTDSLGNNLEGVTVYAKGAASHQERTTSLRDGPNYRITRLRPGEYRIQFDGRDVGFSSEWYPNKGSSEDAVPVTVSAYQTVSGINARLEGGGLLKVSIKNSFGEAIPGVRVGAHSIDVPGEYNDAITGPDGKADIPLGPGSYKIEFQPDEYFPEWYRNKPGFATANPVTIMAGSVTAIQAILAPEGPVVVVAPGTGDSWYTATTGEIRWIGDAGRSPNVKIQLYKGVTFVKTLAAQTPNDNSFLWAIPASTAAANDYIIKIITLANRASSLGGYFSIVKPKITIQAPIGSSIWMRGTTHDIAWTAAGPMAATVRILLLKDGILVRTIAASAPNTGTFAWTIPATGLARGTTYKIKIQTADRAVTKTSPAFTIR